MRSAEILTLPNVERAFLALNAQAATDLGILAKSFTAARHKLMDDEDILTATTLNLLFHLKTWTAKIFEYSVFLSKVAKRRDLGPVVDDIVSEALIEFKALEAEVGYEFSKELRNSSSFHFGFTTALKNIDFVSENANCSLYYGSNYVNSFFPMGDEVMFGGYLERIGANLPSDEDRRTHLREAILWANRATNWARNVQVTTFNRLVIQKFPDLCSETIVFDLPPEMVGTEDTLLPIFFEDKHQKEGNQ